MRNSKLYNIFLILAGIVVGTLVASVCSGFAPLSWLSYGIAFGMTTPLVLDLSVIQLTFALTFQLSLSVVIFIILAIIIGRAITK